MKGIGNFLLLVLLIVTGVWFYRRHEDKKKQQKELEEKLAKEREESRQKLFDLFKTKLDSIKTANSEFAKCIDLKTGYFTNYKMTVWKSQQTKLFNEIKEKSFEEIHLLDEEAKSIIVFKDYYSNAETLRNDFNKQFVKEELENYSTFFDSIEERKLDTQQRTAIVTDEDNNIVIAGAGSGKTTTIVGKVNYIIDRYKIAPEEILLISFTNKSATTLASRIHIDSVEAKTFHRFGIDVIEKVENTKQRFLEVEEFPALIEKIFFELMKDKLFIEEVVTFFTTHLKIQKDDFDFSTKGEQIQYLKEQNLKTFKNEIVKSYQEWQIANWFLFNNIEYEYQPLFPVKYQTTEGFLANYYPDFKIIQSGKIIYVEHFGIDKNNNVPPFFRKDGQTQEEANQKYLRERELKINAHNEYGSLLIQTFSHEFDDQTIFDTLKKKLEEQQIIVKPMTVEEKWAVIHNKAKYEEEWILKLISTFLVLQKSNNYSINDINIKANKIENNQLRVRSQKFIKIYANIFYSYQNYLRNKELIDFSDMINKAAGYIANDKFNRKFSYVIIDEFQDISIGRYQLVKAIKENNPACKLFCVGDDWQSIYRFSGSDIALYKEFENYFGFTVKSKIETTYRFHNPLINLSSDFIQKNPNQAKKELHGASNSRETSYKITYSVTENQDDTYVLQNIFNELIANNENIEKKEIFILSRYGFDINRIKNEGNIFQIQRNIVKKEIVNGKEISRQTDLVHYKTHEGIIITVEFMTVHKAKGLESDIVIILNCNLGKHGFPSEMSDDTILNLLLSEADQFENGEERRLFYVAMTRAKENVFFVADSSFKSKFITELEIESGQSPNRKCPICKSADVVLKREKTIKNGNKYKFYGCTNYLYGCEYSTTEWENKN